MAKVIGLGGVFMRTQNQAEVHAWYEKHLGIRFEAWGTMFQMDDVKAANPKAYNLMSFFKEDSNYVKPSTAGFMLNLIVDDLDALVLHLQSNNIEVLDTQAGDFGKFAWIMDPNGVKIELWQP